MPAPDEPDARRTSSKEEERRQTVKIKVSRSAAPYLRPDASKEMRRAAAGGEAPLRGLDLVTVLFFLGHSSEDEIKERARRTLQALPAGELVSALAEPELAPRLIDFIVRQRPNDLDVLEAAWTHPSLSPPTLSFLAEHAEPEILVVLLAHPGSSPEHGRMLEDMARQKGRPLDVPEGDQTTDLPDDIDEDTLSKYQMALELEVPEKIKMALTGDKEWRTLFLRDSNKMVSSAALKNPRITEGEVLMVARNRTSSDELIRLINLNREWLKNIEIKKALIVHPRTPVHKALKYMSVLTEKEIKFLSKSKNVPQVIVNNARRLLLAKQKRR